MSTDFTVRPVGAPAAVDIQPPVVNAAARAGIPTELPADQTVSPAGTAERARLNPPPVDTQTRQTRFDPATAEVIFRVVDSQNGRVVRQVPDEAILRLRAYTRAADEAAAQTVARNAAQQEHLDHSA